MDKEVKRRGERKGKKAPFHPIFFSFFFFSFSRFFLPCSPKQSQPPFISPPPLLNEAATFKKENEQGKRTTMPRPRVPINNPAIIFTLLFTLFFTTTTPLVHAEKNLHAAWHFSGDVFSVDDQTISVEQDPDPLMRSLNVIKLTVDDTLYLIKLGGCRETATHRYCYTKSGYQEFIAAGGSDENKIEAYEKEPYAKYDGGEKWWGVYLTVDSIVPDVKATLSAEKTTLTPGEDTTITVELTNQGDNTAENARFTLTLPDQYRLTSSDVAKKKNTVIWEGFITPGKTKMFSFTITPTAYEDASLQGTVNFTYAGKTYSITSNTLKLTIPSPYTLTVSFPTEAQVINAQTPYTITITNNEEEKDVTVTSLLVTIPTEVLLLSVSDDWIREKGRLRWSGTIKPRDQKLLRFALAAPFTGDYPFKTIAQLEVDGEPFSHEYDHTFKVATKNLNPDLNVREKTITSREPFRLRLFLENNNEQNNYYAINATITSTHYPPEEISIEKIPYQEKKLVFEKEYIAPFTEEQKTITFNATGTYQTISKETFTFATSRDVTIQPALEHFYDVTYTAPARATAGDEVAIVVTVTNKQDTYASVAMHDDHPGRTIIGTDHASLSLKAGEQRQAYQYTFRIPQNFTNQTNATLTITTAVDDLVTDTTETFHTTIIVEPRLDVETNTTKNDQGTPEKQPQNPEQQAAKKENTVQKDVKPSLGARIIAAFKKFFSIFL
ncbi:hypothetical protein D6783_03240 [Candidatus Woesearchaeota archaeon]|nr:MAG: hypothetical protein D6783_03240 [Candidatus Woesearchaeota archaeon]